MSKAFFNLADCRLTYYKVQRGVFVVLNPDTPRCDHYHVDGVRLLIGDEGASVRNDNKRRTQETRQQSDSSVVLTTRLGGAHQRRPRTRHHDARTRLLAYSSRRSLQLRRDETLFLN